jgi:glutamine amidotransferase
LDYGSGNVHSAVKALALAGADAQLTADRDLIMAADGLVVPGVGAFRSVVDALRDSRADQLIERRLAGGRPVLGICVGMQVMFEHGVERGADSLGLGQWPGAVTELDAPVLPHMGWNTVDAGAGSTLFRGIESERFYFVHSYYPEAADPSLRSATCTYGVTFPAAVERGGLFATQFHPEKSQRWGLRLLENFAAFVRDQRH